MRPPVSRRDFLGLCAASGIAALLGMPRVAAANDGSTLFASCVRLRDDSYAVAVIDPAGGVHALHPLPDRGHDVAYDTVQGLCVAFARRPGTFAVAFDLAGRREPQLFSAPPRHHFYGHGVFSADGGLLYATENDYDRGVGVIGLYDARDGFRRIGGFDAGGTGSHELVWCEDGKVLAIANGGLDTTADFGRTKLNVADMQASLTFVEAGTGRLIGTSTLSPELASLSIRHLAVDRFGAVWFGCQHEGDPTELPPLAGRLKPGATVELFDLPEELQPLPKNYIGSVAASAAGDAIAFSSPKGGISFVLEAASGRFLGDVRLEDVCGLAPAAGTAGGILLTSGTGSVSRLTVGRDVSLLQTGRDDFAFDNHVVRLA